MRDHCGTFGPQPLVHVLIAASFVFSFACDRDEQLRSACGGERYWGREVSDLRDRDPLTRVIDRELSIRPGMTVWDIGAGGGYWTRRAAEEAGPRGKVVATDINRACVEYIQEAKDDWEKGNVSALHVAASEPTGDPSPTDRLMLALGGKGTSITSTADRILVSNSIEFKVRSDDPKAEQVRQSTLEVIPLFFLGLKPTGRLLYLRDFDSPDCLRANQVISLFEEAGFVLLDEADPRALQQPNVKNEARETRCRVFAVFTKTSAAPTAQLNAPSKPKQASPRPPAAY